MAFPPCGQRLGWRFWSAALPCCLASAHWPVGRPQASQELERHTGRRPRRTTALRNHERFSLASHEGQGAVRSVPRVLPTRLTQPHSHLALVRLLLHLQATPAGAGLRASFIILRRTARPPQGLPAPDRAPEPTHKTSRCRVWRGWARRHGRCGEPSRVPD